MINNIAKIINNKNIILDMENYTILSKSVVLIDDTQDKIKQLAKEGKNNITINNFKNPFDDVSRLTTLKLILKDVKEVHNNNASRQFRYSDIDILHNTLPPKLQIIQSPFNKSNDRVFDCALDIIEKGELEHNIYRIGVNYLIEFAKSNNRSLKDMFLNNNVKDLFSSFSISPKIMLDDNIILNLNISESNAGIIKFDCNFDYSVGNTGIRQFLERDLRKDLNENIKSIFSNSSK